MRLGRSALLCLVVLCSQASGQQISTVEPASLPTAHDSRYYVRLFNATHAGHYLHGGIEISETGKSWGFVCAEEFDNDNGLVLCKMFGFSRGEVIAGGVLGQSQEGRFPDRLICSPRDASLSECIAASRTQGDSCTARDTAGVICFNNTRDVLEMRLQDGTESTTQVSGRLEVRLTPITPWGTVCDDSFTDRSATAACRFLGYQYGEFAETGVFGSGEQTLLDEVYCRENQEFLDCEHDSWGLHDCAPSEDVGIQCMNTSVRLLSAIADDPSVGSVELFITSEGGWFEVCDEEWDDNDAKVVCRELGFEDGKALKRNSLGLVSYGSLTALGSVTNVNCVGTEPSLSNCSMDSTDLCEFHGSIIDLAAVVCYPTPVSQVDMDDTHHIWLRGMKCNGNESSIDQCQLPEWGSPGLVDCLAPVRVLCYKSAPPEVTPNESGAHTGYLGITLDGALSAVCADNWRDVDAAVACRDMVKLEPRSGFSGIPQFYHLQTEQWKSFCGLYFTDTEAQVICRQLGYQDGQKVPEGSFGPFRASLFPLGVSCNGSESHLAQCTIQNQVYCDQQSEYAAVSCYNISDTSGQDKYRLDRGYKDNFTASGIIRVRRYNTWGYACDEAFTDKDATAFCHDLGRAENISFIHGVKFSPARGILGPYWLRNPSCGPNAASLRDCLHQDYFCTQSRAVSVVCSTAAEAKINFEKVDRLSGRVQLTVNGQVGAICADTWDDMAASVFCRQMFPNAVSGVAKQFDRSSLPFFLAGLRCNGDEYNLFECESYGWRNVTNTNTACQGQAKEAGVMCHTNVILSEGHLSNESISGRLSVTMFGRDRPVCFDNSFKMREALLVCKEQGLNQAAVLKPYTGLNLDIYYMMKNLNCSSTLTSLKGCSYTIGFCNEGQVRLLCYNDAANALSSWRINEIENRGYGTLTRELPGPFQAVICPVGFTDQNASAICQSKKSPTHTGKVLGSVRFSAKYSTSLLSGQEPVWFGLPRCTHQSNSVTDCNMDTWVSRDCFKQVHAAGVLCSLDATPRIRLMDRGREKSRAGRVEILYNGLWGTVCSTPNSQNQALALCRELGFPNGTVLPRSPKQFGQGSGPIYVKDVQCSVKDSLFLGCSNAGWNITDGCTHNDDLEVICREYEQIFPDADSHYGVVTSYIGQRMVLVCNEGFGVEEARVFCNGQGYPTGIPICCSGLFRRETAAMHPELIYTCDGSEPHLKNCTETRLPIGVCASYASVACLSEAVSDDYHVTVANIDHGPVEILYYGISGFVCADNFKHSDASAVCREEGYNSGLAFHWRDQHEDSLFWASQLRCSGTESKISECPGFALGQSSRCPNIAGAECLMSNDDGNVNLRLNGSHTRGMVEVQIRGRWGSLCLKDMADRVQRNADMDPEANVLCRQLGFTQGGVFLVSSTFDRSSVYVMLTGLRCNGNETKISDCDMFRGNDVQCESHAYDAALQCFVGAQLQVIPPVPDNSHGILKVRKNGMTWHPVCDTGITDREATVACRTLGFSYGKMQCCNAVGGQISMAESITRLTCAGDETDVTNCTMSVAGNCTSGQYAYIHCSSRDPFPPENLRTYRMADFFGNATVERFGVQGGVCADGFGDKEAMVMCRELGYNTGQAIHPFDTNMNYLFMLNRINCSGTESRISQCMVPSLSNSGTCVSGKAAMILCKRTNADIVARIGSGGVSPDSGEAQLVLDGRVMYIDVSGRDTDLSQLANVFCRSVTNKSYAYGLPVRRTIAGTVTRDTILMSNVNCQGQEESILDCSAVFAPRYASFDVRRNRLLYVNCNSG
ncbi:deleted in malignant brain tumors 1 protein-like, partial [Plakobranchus ocellatus]